MKIFVVLLFAILVPPASSVAAANSEAGQVAASGAAKNAITWQTMPTAPSHNPGGLGLTSTGSICTLVTTGESVYSAMLTVTWTYQNRTDTSKDEVKDASPAWVMTGFTMSNMELHNPGDPLNCSAPP